MASSGMTPATFGDIDARESAESDGNPKLTCTYDGCNKSYSSSSSRNRHMLHTHAQHPDGRPATVEERATASKTFNPAAALVEKRTEHQSKVSGAKRKTIEAWSGGEPTSVAKRAPEGAVIRAAAARLPRRQQHRQRHRHRTAKDRRASERLLRPHRPMSSCRRSRRRLVYEGARLAGRAGRCRRRRCSIRCIERCRRNQRWR